MAQVVLKDINKFYDAVHAVKDVNLQIRDKEFVVFVGPSGCGKTTTLRMIAGLEEISSGDISIDGTVVNDLAPMDRDIAMVFQNYALYPHMSVYDNMAFGLKMRKFAKAEIKKRVNEAAEILGIGDYSSASRASSPAASASASRWAAPSCAIPGCSCSTSRSPTSTPSCACRCASSSRSCTSGSAPPPSTSPTTRSRP